MWLAGTSLAVLSRESSLDSTIRLIDGATVNPLGTRALALFFFLRSFFCSYY